MSALLCTTCNRPADDGYVNVAAGERCMDSCHGPDEYGSSGYNDGRLYVGAACTLDGRPARVVGRSLDFAVVAEIPGGASYEFAWSTVGRIMAAGGNFAS